MASRLKLQETLETLLGSRNVYFDPPASVSMKYPAIRYRLSDINKTTANDGVYSAAKLYEIILIDKNPDSEFIDQLIKLTMCGFVRSYVADNLYHYVFRLYY